MPTEKPDPLMPNIPLPPITPEQEAQLAERAKLRRQEYRNRNPDRFSVEDERQEYRNEERGRRQGEDRW